MPTDANPGALPPEEFSAAEENRVKRCLALRQGLTPAVLFGTGLILNWPVFYLAAVFAALFTQAPAPMPTAAGLRLLALAAVMFLAAWAISVLLLPYPVVLLAAIALGLGLAFRAAVNGANMLVIVLAMLAVLLIPFLARISAGLAGSISVWLVVNMGLALVASRVAFAVFPAASPQPTKSEPGPSAFNPDRRLARMCLVSIPFALVFFVIDSGAALVLIFVAILTAQLTASTAAGSVVAKGMMIANVAGGAVAVLIYEALVMAPFLPLAILLVFCACLFFSGRAVSGDALAGSALTTVLILVGGSLGPISDGAEEKMLTRLWQIGLALSYILVMFVIVDRWLPERKEEEAPRNSAP